jgi:hypothetical protein
MHLTQGGKRTRPCEQVVPVDRVQFLPLGFGEPDLGQHTARSGVPLPRSSIDSAIMPFPPLVQMPNAPTLQA